LSTAGANNILLSSSQNQDKIVIHNLNNLRPSLHPLKELKGAVGQIVQQDKTILAVEQNKVLIPPLYNRYVSWGFADHSLRVGPYDSDRALYIYESDFLPPNGEILCGTVPNSRLVVIAGTSSLISVWRLKGKNYQLKLVQNLYGHLEAITCLTSSSAYGIIVSGSRDRTCIIWDLNRLVFSRQLGDGTESDLVHPAPISAVAINDLTGDIATCSSSWLFFWSINGQLLASVNTSLAQPSLNTLVQNQPLNSSSTQILCVTFSLYNEWSLDNVIMTGSSDGVVRIWSLEYIQVPIEEKTDLSPHSSISSVSSEEVTVKENNHLSLLLFKDEIVRRMSLASEKEEQTKEGNEKENSDESSCESSNKSSNDDWFNVGDDLKPDSTSSYDSPVPQIAHSKSSNEFFSMSSISNETNEDTQTKLQPEPQSACSILTLPKIRTSKSDTSLGENRLDKNESILKPGFKWERRLALRGKLTMHTAFEVKENTEPAAITALSISKDNKTIFVGDARGRIFNWSVAEAKALIGKDHLLKEDATEVCTQCNVKFTFSERKHHCRNCGLAFCAK